MICLLFAAIQALGLIYCRCRWDSSVQEKEVYLCWLGVVFLYTLWGILELFGLRFLRLPGIAASVFLFGMMLFLEVYPLFWVEHPHGNEKRMLVLGAPVLKGKATPCLSSRGVAAAQWLNAHPQVTAVLSGGKGQIRTEAQALTEIITDRGIEPSRLIPESESTTTDENFLRSRPILESLGWQNDEPLIVVTNRFHVFRLRHYAEKHGYTNLRYLVTPTPFPVRYLWVFREVILVCRWWVLGI